MGSSRRGSLGDLAEVVGEVVGGRPWSPGDRGCRVRRVGSSVGVLSFLGSDAVDVPTENVHGAVASSSGFLVVVGLGAPIYSVRCRRAM